VPAAAKRLQKSRTTDMNAQPTFLESVQLTLPSLPRIWSVHVAIGDTSSLVADVMRYVNSENRAASIASDLSFGTLRLYITHAVWAEVPRKLSEIAEAGRVDEDAAHAAWWTEYVPYIRVVDCSSLPPSKSAQNLLRRDVSDAPMASLHDFLAPVVAWTADRDLLDNDVGLPCWRVSASACSTVTSTGNAAYFGTMIGTAAGHGMVSATRGVIRLSNETWFLILLIVVCGGLYVSRRRWIPAAKSRGKAAWNHRDEVADVAHRLTAHVKNACETWDLSMTGTEGVTDAHVVARLLVNRQPMTRSQIVESILPEATQSRKAAVRRDLLPILKSCSAFVEIRRNHWQIGRSGIDFGHAHMLRTLVIEHDES